MTKLGDRKRSVWWVIHHWAGLKLSLLMSFILLTGTLAVFAHEIDWLIFPAMRVEVREGPYASWGAWAAAAQAAEPGAEIDRLSYPIEPWFAASVQMTRADGSLVFVQVDPWTARVTGATPFATAQRFLRQTHRQLMLPVNWGVPIVGALSLVLLASMVTGLVAYKKFWRGFGRVPRWRRGRDGEARRFTGDLHRLAGLWSLPFLTLMAVTGVWYLVEQLGAAAPDLPYPDVGTSGAVLVGDDLDRVVAAARRAYPDLRVRGIRMPYDGDPGVIIEGQARAVLVRERANAVFVEPEKRTVLAVSRGEALGVHQRISEAADPLHFGTFEGMVSKTLWFLSGLALTGLSVTGVMIFSLRLKRAEPERGRRRRNGWARAWDGMGVWAYPAMGLVILCLALTPPALWP